MWQTVLNEHLRFYRLFLTCLLRNKAFETWLCNRFTIFFATVITQTSLKQSLPLFLNLSETFTARAVKIVIQVFLQRLASNICHSEITARLITDFSLYVISKTNVNAVLLYSIFYLLLFSNVITQSLSL
jgi:hypothetical protein